MISNLYILLTLAFYLGFMFLITNNKTKIYITLIGSSATLFILWIIIWTAMGCPNATININWLSANITTFALSSSIDFFSFIFFSVALYVTWSIIEFAHYYMENDPNMTRFVNTLILFLLFMLILISANNLFILFIGWEGVGIMSFILISWWFTRSDANSSALQAIIYNRIGDTGLILVLALSAIYVNDWNISTLNNYPPSTLVTIILVGIIVAAAGKSAQFTLHPWLPSAMEGPTPVSALLHSSTMVVAGVFLLIRTNPLFQSEAWAMNVIGILGATTALFAASVAITQNDIKKVVAYSTTSQLGLMVVALSINAPTLAFFHICTHAFFKALLFLCSGSVIHSLDNEQDLRKVSIAGTATPFTTAAIVIASMALCGLPFMAGFFSKDLILESVQINNINIITAILAFVATLFTALYTLRTIYFIAYLPSNNKSISPISEENYNLNFSLSRLTIGAIIAGWALVNYFFNFNPLLINLTLKSIPLILLIISSLFMILNIINPSNKQATNFLAANWYFIQITHNIIPANVITNSINGALRSLDQGWNINITVTLIALTHKIINTTQSAFSGQIIKYIIATITITCIIPSIILNT